MVTAVEVGVEEGEVSQPAWDIVRSRLTFTDDRGRGRGGHGGGGGGNDRHAPESTGVRFRKMVIKLGDEEVSYIDPWSVRVKAEQTGL
jgi:hypothetical protein